MISTAWLIHLNSISILCECVKICYHLLRSYWYVIGKVLAAFNEMFGVLNTARAKSKWPIAFNEVISVYAILLPRGRNRQLQGSTTRKPSSTQLTSVYTRARGRARTRRRTRPVRATATKIPNAGQMTRDDRCHARSQIGLTEMKLDNTLN